MNHELQNGLSPERALDCASEGRGRSSEELRSPESHVQALELMLELKANFTEEESQEVGSQREWLASHLNGCADCTVQHETILQAAADMRMAAFSMTANPQLVRATQLRVRARAMEMRQQQNNLRPLWISCVLACAWAVISVPFLYQGFEWLGHNANMPSIVWQTCFVIMTLMPIAAVGTIAISNGLQGKFQKRTS
ncbi:MAG: hypothetical protein JWO13_3179 [Acidobacteriales bacterium]|nr:hypothetical protein [Terriglobales bacterium]